MDNYDAVYGFQCNECGSLRIRFVRPHDEGLYEGDTLTCRDCGAHGNEQTFVNRDGIEVDDESPAIPVFDSVWIRDTIVSVCVRTLWESNIEIRKRGMLVDIWTETAGPYSFKITPGKSGWYAHVARVRHDHHASAANGDHTVLALFEMVLTIMVNESIEGGIHHVTAE